VIEKMMLSTKKFLEVIRLVPMEIDGAEGALLDEVIPPTLTEKSLPVLAMVASITGFFAMLSLEPVAQNFILLGPVLLVLYQYIRTDRQQKAKKRSYSDLRLLPVEIMMLQQSLRKNHSNFNA
jgi:hypothetical protein